MKEEKIEIKSKPGTLAVDVYVNDKKLNPKASQKIWDHSPDGFSVGYHGSGCAQTALGILLELTNNPDEAIEYHQRFKREYVANWHPDQIYYVPHHYKLIERWLIQDLGYDV